MTETERIELAERLMTVGTLAERLGTEWKHQTLNAVFYLELSKLLFAMRRTVVTMPISEPRRNTSPARDVHENAHIASDEE